ncbi:phage tail assembly protein [Adonisia turfae]
MADRPIVDTLALTKPVKVFEELRERLEFREPNVGALRRLGAPFTLSPDGAAKIDTAVALAWAAEMTGLSNDQVDRLAYGDQMMATMIVVGFLGGSSSPSGSGISLEAPRGGAETPSGEANPSQPERLDA